MKAKTKGQGMKTKTIAGMTRTGTQEELTRFEHNVAASAQPDHERYACPDGAACKDADCIKENERRAVERSPEMLPKRSVMVVRLVTENDRNGNPRRVSLIINADEGPFGRWQAGAVIVALDEGYTGPSVIKPWLKSCMEGYYDLTVVEGPTFQVPASEYKATLKTHSKKGGV